MAREILFKAKRKDNGEWVSGNLFIDEKGEKHEILVGYTNYRIAWEVDANTFCQFIGLLDKNGNKIWENDILSIKQVMDGLGTYYHPPISYPANVMVKWDLCSWMWEVIGKDKYYIQFPDAWCHYESEVIGNIFDNPELLTE